MIRRMLRPLARRIRPRPKPIPHVLTGEILARNAAAAIGVSPAVHPDDHIFWYGVDDRGLDGCARYFTDAAECAARLDSFVGPGHHSLLEFAAGYGRVTRYLALNPRFRVTACDIHPQAVEFMSKTLGIPAIPSTDSPETFRTPEKYDVAFALSFFSHLPRRTFGPWLKALFECVSPGGLLIFTTHGMKSRKVIPPLVDGFCFEPHSEQPDLDASSYGTTIVHPEFVIREIYAQTRAPIVSFTENNWWSCQDTWVVQANRS